MHAVCPPVPTINLWGEELCSPTLSFQIGKLGLVAMATSVSDGNELAQYSVR